MAQYSRSCSPSSSFDLALVFGSQRSPSQKIRVAVADEDHPEHHGDQAALQAEGTEGTDHHWGKGDGDPLDRASAERLIRDGALSVAVVLPKGLGASPRVWRDTAALGPGLTSRPMSPDPIAPQMVQGLLQKVSFTSMPESLATEGMSLFEKYGGSLTPRSEHPRIDGWLTSSRTQVVRGSSAANRRRPASTRRSNVMQPRSRKRRDDFLYAAGVGVMFLLFSCSAAVGAAARRGQSTGRWPAD